MSIDIEEVTAADFSKITLEKLPHLKIEDELIKLGGEGVTGVSFKKDALKAAGWKYHELTSYNAHAEEASQAFNRIREQLMKGADKEEMLDNLKAAEV
ncbi:MAG: hypothetical protein D6B28_09655 [Gammaproteobacteria bacterium]|nr:MAG: hypothetical protein D6B28_09655 [Gammaproteobacteria bacterium]